MLHGMCSPLRCLIGPEDLASSPCSGWRLEGIGGRHFWANFSEVDRGFAPSCLHDAIDLHVALALFE